MGKMRLTLIGLSQSGCFHLSQGMQKTASPMETLGREKSYWKTFSAKLQVVLGVQGDDNIL